MIPFLRAVVTSLRGRVCCQMSMCGRAARLYGYCAKHLHNYRYAPEPFGEIFQRADFYASTSIDVSPRGESHS